MMNVTYSYKVQTLVALGLAPFSSKNLTISVLSFSTAIIRAGVPSDGYYYNKLNIEVHACSNKPQH